MKRTGGTCDRRAIVMPLMGMIVSMGDEETILQPAMPCHAMPSPFLQTKRCFDEVCTNRTPQHRNVGTLCEGAADMLFPLPAQDKVKSTPKSTTICLPACLPSSQLFPLSVSLCVCLSLCLAYHPSLYREGKVAGSDPLGLGQSRFLRPCGNRHLTKSETIK